MLLTLLGISFLFFLGYVFRNPLGASDSSLLVVSLFMITKTLMPTEL